MARFAVNLDGKVGAVEQIVGRERRGRVSHHDCSGDA